MEISQFFMNGDVKGAIAYMREHEEFQDVLPAYIALFENGEYRSYDVPEQLNQILRLYQVYYRDIFYCGVPETEAADKLLTQLKALLELPDADEDQLAQRLCAVFEQHGYHALFGKPRDFTAPMSGRIPCLPFTVWSCRAERRNILSTFSRALCSAAGWII